MQPLPGQLSFDAGDLGGDSASFVSPGDHVAGNEDCRITGAPSDALCCLAWLAFTGDHSEDQAAARFRQRFGHPPEYVLDWGDGTLRCGPVPEGRG
jgi:hypothetical protein